MQFRPVMPPDDLPMNDDGELQLPDELSELALQLEAEAQQLAHLYPVQEDQDLAPSADEDEFVEIVSKSDSLVPALSWQWISASVVAGITLASATHSPPTPRSRSPASTGVTPSPMRSVPTG